jgi:hypothetical protein
MSMQRRLGRLEAALPENAPSVRILFKSEGEPDPVVEPPLRPGEQAIVTVFVNAATFSEPAHEMVKGRAAADDCSAGGKDAHNISRGRARPCL